MLFRLTFIEFSKFLIFKISIENKKNRKLYKISSKIFKIINIWNFGFFFDVQNSNRKIIKKSSTFQTWNLGMLKFWVFLNFCLSEVSLCLTLGWPGADLGLTSLRQQLGFFIFFSQDMHFYLTCLKMLLFSTFWKLFHVGVSRNAFGLTRLNPNQF